MYQALYTGETVLGKSVEGFVFIEHIFCEERQTINKDKNIILDCNMLSENSVFIQRN